MRKLPPWTEVSSKIESNVFLYVFHEKQMTAPGNILALTDGNKSRWLIPLIRKKKEGTGAKCP